MIFKFEPKVKVIGKVSMPLPSTQKLAEETMLFSADWNFARENSGPLTRRIMNELSLTEEFLDAAGSDQKLVIDTRVTMTMKGVYPSMPQWHCDDVPRHERYAQPDLTLCSDDVQHFTVLLSDNHDGVSQTEFITEPFEIAVDEQNVWESVDRAARLAGEGDGWLSRHQMLVKDFDIVQFNQPAIHRASPAHNSGWRLFFRASYTHRPPANQIRKQVQVYARPGLGW